MVTRFRDLRGNLAWLPGSNLLGRIAWREPLLERVPALVAGSIYTLPATNRNRGPTSCSVASELAVGLESAAPSHVPVSEPHARALFTIDDRT